MGLSLVTESNPGTAFWSPSVVVAGRVTFNIADGSTKTVTIPAGLENATPLVDYVSEPNAYGATGGLLFASISGTTLTINVNGIVVVDGLIVSYVITGPA